MVHLLRTTTAALCLATPALADLTAPQVWDNWKEMTTISGQAMSPGREVLANGTLTLTDVALSLEMPEGRVSGTIPLIAMTEQGDGTVAITLSPQYDLRMQMTPASGESLDFTLRIAMPGMVMIASGDPGTLRHDVVAPEIQVSVVGMIVDGVPTDLDMALTMANMTGAHTRTAGDGMAFESRFSADTMAFAASGSDPAQSGADLTLNASFADLLGTSASTGGGLTTLADPARMVAAGARFDSTYSHGGGRLAMTMISPDTGTFDMVGTIAAGQHSVAMSQEIIDYSGTVKTLDVTMAGDALLFPENRVSLEEFGYGLKLPMTRTETLADFALRLDLGGLDLGDLVWGAIDPADALPRDPGFPLIDLSGEARMLVDAADPAPGGSPGMPGDLYALTLNDLRLSLAGAEMTGNGAFTFDTTDPAPFGGMPAPDGTLELQMVGANDLLDRLVRLGLIPQDQAMFGRMMMGLFAIPTGEDTLSSKIEVTRDGSVSANGQRLR